MARTLADADSESNLHNQNIHVLIKHLATPKKELWQKHSGKDCIYGDAIALCGNGGDFVVRLPLGIILKNLIQQIKENRLLEMGSGTGRVDLTHVFLTHVFCEIVITTSPFITHLQPVQSPFYPAALIILPASSFKHSLSIPLFFPIFHLTTISGAK